MPSTDSKELHWAVDQLITSGMLDEAEELLLVAGGKVSPVDLAMALDLLRDISLSLGMYDPEMAKYNENHVSVSGVSVQDYSRVVNDLTNNFNLDGSLSKSIKFVPEMSSKSGKLIFRVY